MTSRRDSKHLAKSRLFMSEMTLLEERKKGEGDAPGQGPAPGGRDVIG